MRLSPLVFGFLLSLWPMATIGAPEQASPKYLTGRLEELSGRGASLPIGLSLKGLKTQTARMDPSAVAGHPVTGLVSSFPSDWLGKWGGHLQVNYAYFDPRLEPEKAYSKGASNIVVFNFTRAADRISLKPANLYFPPQLQPLGQNQMALADLKQLQAQSAALNQAIDPSQPRRLMNVIALGEAQAGDTGGLKTDNVVLLNSLRQLSTNVMEQDIIVGQRLMDQTNRTVGYGWTESVIRFSKYRNGLLWAQVAYVEYGGDQKPLMQLGMQGWLERDWKRYSNEVERLAGGRSMEELDAVSAGVHAR